MATRYIDISDIDLDHSIQVRCKIDSNTVQDYAEHFEAKKPPLPPIVVFGPDSRGKYFLSEGWHRVKALQRLKKDRIAATVMKGGWKDALEHALGSNAAHGLRRNNADKRRAVELAFKHFEGMSNDTIAERCGVSRRLVAYVRKEHQGVHGAHPDEPVTRIGRDGKTYSYPPPPTSRPAPPQRDAEYSAMPPPPPEPVEPENTPETEEGQLPKDIKGRTIPPQCVTMWQRRGEILELLNSISNVRKTIKRAQDDRDPLFCGKGQGRTLINFSSAVAHLNQIYDDIKAALPTRVCPVCQGMECKHCSGLGIISEYRWKMVPSEFRR